MPEDPGTAQERPFGPQLPAGGAGRRLMTASGGGSIFLRAESRWSLLDPVLARTECRADRGATGTEPARKAARNGRVGGEALAKGGDPLE